MSDRITAGVVIDLPEPHATVVRNWRRRAGDPQADLVPPHVTLLPPTSVLRTELDRVCEHLSEVARLEEPFAMHLSGTGTFRPLSQVVYIQVSSGVGQCERLAAAIRRGPLHRPLDFPFHPHVTVAHDVVPAALDEVYDGLSDFVARFRADRFALFTRSARREWIVEHEFPLGARGTGEPVQDRL